MHIVALGVTYVALSYPLKACNCIDDSCLLEVNKPLLVRSYMN